MNRLYNQKSYLILIIQRHCSNIIKSKSLNYSEHGDPLKVMKEIESSFGHKLKNNEVLIKFLAATINPADINTIQGEYPLKPPLPAIGGNEGYAKVIDAGMSSVLKEGAYVIPRNMNSGTWTNYKICNDNQLIHLKNVLPPEVGAIAHVNPSTAYRMLNDFTTLSRGNVFIQNGGTSAVAIYATQFAKLKGVSSISIIRSRKTKEETDNVKQKLQEYGATFVLTEDEVKHQLSDVLKQIGPAKLGFSCVGGKGVLPLLKGLCKSGIIVTYGGMNRVPMTIPVSSLIFSDIHIRGFWISDWSSNMQESLKREEMLDEISDAFRTGTILPAPFAKFDFSTQWKEALSKSVFTSKIPEGLTKKSILMMNT